MEASIRRALFGCDEAPPPTAELTAGPVRVRLEGTRLVDLRAHGHVLLHGVSFLYRDIDWGTPGPVVDRFEAANGPHGFSARIEAHIPCEPRIRLRLEIRGDAQGRLRYDGVATPEGDIDAQRLGLCVMHPSSASGQRVEVEHDDGRRTCSSFPTQVPPWPPFTQVRSLRHEYAPGAWATCSLQGASFELEDQRNNADASFKIYSRSNQMPRPYRLRGGQAVRQSLDFMLDGEPTARVASEAREPGPDRATRIILGDGFPRASVLGIGLAPQDLDAQATCLHRVAELAPVQLHLVLDRLDDALDLPLLAGCVALSRRGLRLDIRDASQAGGASFVEMAARLRAHDIAVEAVCAFPATPPTVDALRDAFPGVAIGGGTPYFFAQVNRLEDLGPVNFIGFTVCAIVHGADDDSPMHGLSCLPTLVDTLRHRHPGLAVRVGPSGIAAPRSPLGRQPEGDGMHRQALARHDPRSGALYGAAWLVGHLSALLASQVQAGSVWGLGDDDGLFLPQPPGDEALPRLAPLAPLSPAGWVMRELCGATRFRVVKVEADGDDAAPVAALWMQQASEAEHPRQWTAQARGAGLDEGGAQATSTLIVANLRAEPVCVSLPSLGLHAQVALLDAPAWITYTSMSPEAAPPAPWRAVELPADARTWLPAYAILRATRHD